MRFWFEHSSEVSLREQVVAQVTLGILTGELSPGERLPSIRELARRFDLHANTVSAGYRQLEAEGWVSSRKGSGVYVQTTRPESARTKSAATSLDRLVANLFENARRLNIPDADLIARIAAWPTRIAIDRILLIEPDPELRRIVLAELAEAITLPIEGRDFGPPKNLADTTGALVCTLPSKLDRVKSDFGTTARIHCLRVRSAPASLAAHLPPPESRTGALVGIASAWPEFLRFARTMLIAAGFSPDALIVRDAREPGWQHGLSQAAAVICDLPTAQSLPGAKVIISRVLAEGVPEELAALTLST